MIQFAYSHALRLNPVCYAFYEMQEHTSWTRFILHIYKDNILTEFNIFEH